MRLCCVGGGLIPQSQITATAAIFHAATSSVQRGIYSCGSDDVNMHSCSSLNLYAVLLIKTEYRTVLNVSQTEVCCSATEQEVLLEEANQYIWMLLRLWFLQLGTAVLHTPLNLLLKLLLITEGVCLMQLSFPQSTLCSYDSGSVAIQIFIPHCCHVISNMAFLLFNPPLCEAPHRQSVTLMLEKEKQAYIFVKL